MSKSTSGGNVETTTGGSGGRGGGRGPRKILKPILLSLILLGVLYIAYTVTIKHAEEALEEME